MIDSLPVSSPAVPAVPGFNSSPAGEAAADPINAAATQQAVSGSPLQPSFASALQNRIKSIALNKATVAPAAIAAEQRQNPSPNLPIQFFPAPSVQVPTSSSSAGTTASDALSADNMASAAKLQDEDDSSSIPLPPAASLADIPATPVLLALNAGFAPPAPPSLPTAASPVAEAVTSNSGERIAANQVAILAAQAEKLAPETAKPNTMGGGDIDFSDVLRDAFPHASTTSLQGHAPSAPVTLLPPSREIAAPLGSTQWAGDVGNQLVWMTNQRESRVDLVLNPPQLGRIEVSITLSGDQASASFVSGNPEVRDALQGSLPRLREVLADAGVFLGQANIGAESFRQGGDGAEKGGKSPDDSPPPAAPSLLGFDDGPLSITAAQPVNRGRGLIDLFA